MSATPPTEPATAAPSAGPQPAAADGRWRSVLRGEYGIYTFILALGIGVHAIDTFMVATIMPSVVADIGGVAFYAWAAMLYMVGSVVGTVCAAPVRASFALRRAYPIAGMLFLSGALGCALAPTMPALLAGRLVEGLGGGLIVAMSMSMITQLYPVNLRKRILASMSTVWAVAALLGPTVGGVFAQTGWWRGAFWTSSLLLTGFVLLAALRLPRRERRVVPLRLPFLRLSLIGGGVLGVASVGLLESAWQRPLLTLASLALIGAAFRRDGRAEVRLFPRAPLSLRRPIGPAYWSFMLISGSHTTVGIFLPLQLATLYHLPPLLIGYFNGVLALGWTAAATLTSGWHGRRETAAMLGGPLLMMAGIAGLALGVGKLPLAAVGVCAALIGAGIGLVNIHMVALTMSNAAPGEEQITASSIPTMRFIGLSVGSAVAGMIANLAGLDATLDAASVRTSLAAVYTLAVVGPVAILLLTLRVLWFRKNMRT